MQSTEGHSYWDGRFIIIRIITIIIIIMAEMTVILRDLATLNEGDVFGS